MSFDVAASQAEDALKRFQREQADAELLLGDNALRLGAMQEEAHRSLEELATIRAQTKHLKQRVSNSNAALTQMQSTLTTIAGIFIAFLVGMGFGLKGPPLIGCVIIGGVTGYFFNPLLTKLVRSLS